jgi:lysine N6-hydroxylase
MRLKCVGIGIGPSNLSLASLFHSYTGLSGVFFERKLEFSWHEEMHINGSSIQVSPIKDLVTLSDPRSLYSFLSYLHHNGNLYHFLNAGFESVSRKEFEKYMKWASVNNELVNFGEEVVSVNIGDSENFIVQTHNLQVEAENISVGVGTKAYIPDFALAHLGNDQFHVNQFVTKARDLAGKRAIVIGGGQSGAEAFLDLISRSQVTCPGYLAEKTFFRWTTRLSRMNILCHAIQTTSLSRA